MDNGGASISEQSRRIKDYARKNGIEVVKEFVELTSIKTGKTQFDSMLSELQSNKNVKGIILYSVNARLSIYSQSRLYGLKETGYKFHFACEKLNSSNKGMLAIIFIRWGIASYYSQELSKSIKKGLARSKIKGKK